MNEISDDAIMKALGRQMNIAVAKQVVATGNLANLDTPGYRTREVDFEQVLAREVGKATLAGTSGTQLGGATSDGVTVKEAEGLQSRRDGNNVQLDRELLQMTRRPATSPRRRRHCPRSSGSSATRLTRAADVYTLPPHSPPARAHSMPNAARIEVAVSNMANAESTRGPDGQPYRRRDVVLASDPRELIRCRDGPDRTRWA